MMLRRFEEMCKVSFLSLAVVLSASLGVTRSKELSASLLYEIASLMRDPIENVGSCGSGCCVEIDGEAGKTRTRLLHLNEEIITKDDPCLVYTCTEEGLSMKSVQCNKNEACTNGAAPTLVPGKCCPECVEPRLGKCDFSEWSGYGPCSVTCGKGQRARVRSVNDINDEVDFLNCSGSLTHVESCNALPCIAEPCEFEWGEYGECSVTCGGGTKTRRPKILKPAEEGGYCPGPETMDCNTNRCPAPCEFEWEYDRCSVTCGGGTTTRRPNILKPAEKGGYCPGPETVSCSTNRCPRCECPCTCYGHQRCNKECRTSEELKSDRKECTPDSDCVCPPGSIKCTYNRCPPERTNCTAEELSAPVCIVEKEDIDDCGDCKANAVYADTDKDGWNDLCDSCPTITNPDQRDMDGDGFPDACENTFSPGK